MPETGQSLLTLVIAPEIEDPLVDWLLDRDDVPGFSSHPINGHGASEHAMSLGEQVAGRRRQVMFHLHLDTDVARSLVGALRQAFAGSGLHFWITPLLQAGHIE
ncbi:MAG: DUF3240 family protein [Chromatiales bacterium]|jgi:hypothetical protein